MKVLYLLLVIALFSTLNSAAELIDPDEVSIMTFVHSEYETLAQSICTSIAVSRGLAGWTYAVQRRCDSSTASCSAICDAEALRQQDSQTAGRAWSCIGAIHVYNNRPISQASTPSNPHIGLKVYWSSSYHLGRNCGPNYCCCRAAA